MGIGTSIFLIALGAILYFAVDADVSGLEISDGRPDPDDLRDPRAGDLAVPPQLGTPPRAAERTVVRDRDTY